MLVEHKVLLCDELLDAIFCQMSTGMVHPEDRPDDIRERNELRRSLARAAQVCRAFSEAALKVLWCALDDLLPLLSLLPGLVKMDDAYVFSEPIDEEGWARFCLYAKRVRGLCHYASGPRIHSTVWWTLMAHCHGSPLLPRLQVLDVEKLSVTDIAPLHLYLSPTLLELYLSLNNAQNPVVLPSVCWSLLDLIAKAAPNLTILYLDEQFRVPSRGLMTLGRLKHLKELKLCDPGTLVDGATLESLATLPHLRVLSIEDVSLDGRLLKLDQGFTLLENLYVHGNPDDIVAMLAACRLNNLQHSDFMMHCIDGILPATHISSVISRLPPTVHKLRLGFCDGEFTSPPQCTLKDIVELAAPLKGITELAFDSGMRLVGFSDADLKVIPDLWPGLRRFAFEEDQERPRVVGKPHPTFSGILDLAGRSPELASFQGTGLDVTALPAEHEIPILHYPLRRLVFKYYVGDATPLAIAKAINRVFPVLDTTYDVKLEKLTYPRGAKPWYRVLQYLNDM